MNLPTSSMNHACSNRSRLSVSLKRSALLAGIVMAAAAPALGAANEASANWPQWRGPLANGIAPKGSPPTTWSETENVKWKVKVAGRGMSTPIIWRNQIFLQSAIPTGKKVEPPAEEKKAAANFTPNVFGQAQAPADGAAPDGQRRRRPGGG